MTGLNICNEAFRKLPLLLLLLVFVASPLNTRTSSQLLNPTQQEEEHKKEEGTSVVYKALEVSRAARIQEITEHTHIHEGKESADHSYTDIPLHKNLSIYNLTLRAPPACC